MPLTDTPPMAGTRKKKKKAEAFYKSHYRKTVPKKNTGPAKFELRVQDEVHHIKNDIYKNRSQNNFLVMMTFFWNATREAFFFIISEKVDSK